MTLHSPLHQRPGLLLERTVRMKRNLKNWTFIQCFKKQHELLTCTTSGVILPSSPCMWMALWKISSLTETWRHSLPCTADWSVSKLATLPHCSRTTLLLPVEVNKERISTTATWGMRIIWAFHLLRTDHLVLAGISSGFQCPAREWGQGCKRYSWNASFVSKKGVVICLTVDPSSSWLAKR